MSSDTPTVRTGPEGPPPAVPSGGGDAAGGPSSAGPGAQASDDLVLARLRWGPDGRCRAFVPTAPAAGVPAPPDDPTDWLDVLHTAERARTAAHLTSVLAGGPASEDPVRLADGERWVIVRLHPVDARGERVGPGDPAQAGAAGFLIDVTRSFAATARMARLVASFNRLRHPDEVVRAMLDEGVALLRANTATLHVLSDAGDELVVAGSAGLPPDVLGERFGRLSLSSPLPAAEVVRTGHTVSVGSDAERRERYPELDDLRMTVDPAFAVVALKDAQGRAFGAMAVGFGESVVLRDHDRDLLEDVAAQCALALDRARLAAAAERAQDHLGFLDALSATLSSNLQVDTVLAQLTGLTVPRIADWCTVRLAVTPGRPEPRLGVAHVDPDQVGRLHRMLGRISRAQIFGSELGAALAAGRPLIRGSRAAATLRTLFDDPEDRATIDAVGVDAVAIFPLQARGRLLGAMAFGNRPGRPLLQSEIDLATAVAARAGVIVDNARLFDEQSGVARALQDSLLPGSLPDIPGIELGARYRAAGQGLDVGGDFYDAFRADANWWIIAVGDVCGHGVEAAATTGLVRHTIRSAALDGVMPSIVLGRLNEMLLRSSAERGRVDDDQLPLSPRFCTVLVGAVQPTPRGVDIVVCSGGHPLPLVRRSVGRVDPVGVPGTLLGVTPDVSLTDTVVHLDPGESLVCYTDGLMDRRAGRRSFGEEGIVKAMLQGKGRSAGDMAGLIEAEALAFVDVEPADDMAVLALRAEPREG